MIMTTKCSYKSCGVQQCLNKGTILGIVVDVIVAVALLLDSFAVDSWFLAWADTSQLECAHWIDWDMDEGYRWDWATICGC